MTSADETSARDLAARRAAQAIFDRPVVLEAGAGTGKTTTLVARMLCWMLGAGWHEHAGEKDDQGEPLSADRIAARVLDGVVAITFTEAAAAEMALRLGRRLSELARSGEVSGPGFDRDLLLPTPPEREELSLRARALLGSLERVTVSTIHALCSSLLRRHALALGLHPDFRIDAREDLAEDVAREVVERATRRAYAGGGAHPILALAARGIDSRQLVEATARFTSEGTPAGTFAEPSFSPPRIAATIKGLARRSERLLEIADGRLRRVARSDFAARVETALAATARLAGDFRPDAGGDGKGDPGAALAAFVDFLQDLAAIWEAKLIERLGSWAKGRLIKGEEAAFEDAAEAIGEAAGAVAALVSHLSTLDPELLEDGRRALHPLLVEIESLLRSRGIATFQSLLVEARNLLLDEATAGRERRRIRQLLVDEFQDTDEIQCDIVDKLALTGPPGERPGLFVVGDPKQSIYAWRNADLAAYEAFVGRALAAGGERHRLVRNFRSAPAILEEVERSIAPVMLETAGRQPPFEPLLPGRGAEQPDGFSTATEAAIEYWVSWHRDRLERGSTNSRQAAAIEARAIAADVRRLHDDRGEPWNEFAVLLRTTSRLDEFLEAFRAAGVPFAVTGDRQYFRRREIIDAAALVRAVVHPLDHIALVTHLRSTAVGVPDAAWIPLWKHRLPGLVSELGGAGDEERLAALDAAIAAAAADTPDLPDLGGVGGVDGWPLVLGAAVRAIADLRRAFRTLPVDRFIESLRSRVLLEAGEAARYLGVYRVANLERFFRRLEEGLADGHGEIDTVLRALRRSVGEGREDEEALPKEAATAAVQVMTIHKAKGLEFGHVYLPQLHARPRPTEHDKFDADRRPAAGEEREFVLFRKPSMGWDRVEAERVESAAAEQVRTLYVAMTRAQKRLVLLGAWPRKPNPPSGTGVPEPLRLLHHRAPFLPSMAGLGTAIEDPTIGFDDPVGARWKIPDLARQRDEPAGVTAKQGLVDAPTPRQVEAWSATLGADRERAERRMARPLFAAASAHGEALAEPRRRADDGGGLDRPAALAMGRIVHRALETWDLEAGAEGEWRRRREQALAAIASAPGLEEAETARRAERWCRELFDRLAAGSLLPRLRDLAPAIVARELPLAVASGPDHEALVGATGTVDLLVRGDSAAEFVVIDYKTDEVESEAQIAERARIYAPQLAVYARAVQAALELRRAPRAELWFLWPGIARAVDLGA